MTRFAIFNDPHYTRHPPQKRGDSYPGKILDKFHEVAHVAKRLKVDAIGCTGDWFHRKGKVTFNEANDILAVLSSFHRKGFDVIGILGNHDIAGHKIESLDNRAVGSLVHSKVLQLLDHYPYVASDCVVTGTSYFHGCDKDDEARIRMYGGPKIERHEGIHIHLAHGTLINKGSFFGEYTLAPDLIDLLHENDRLPDVIVCGHLHFSEGVRYYPNPASPKHKIAVCRIGSLGRVSVDDFDRQPAALLIAVQGTDTVIREFPIGEPIDYREERQENSETGDEYQERIENFVAALRAEADSWSVADHRSLLAEITERLGHGEEVFDLALKHVERKQ